MDGGEDWGVWSETYTMVHLAAEVDDLDEAARELLAWYPFVDTRNLDKDTGRRADARLFVSACARVLEREASIGHPQEATVTAAMRDVATRAEDVLTTWHKEELWRIGELRARHRSRTAIMQASRSHAAVRDTLPTVGAARPAATG